MSSGYSSRGRLRLGFKPSRALAAAALLLSALTFGSSHAAGALRIEVLSNRADLISGGDALVQVDLPSGTAASDVTMKLGATDVTNQFGLRPDGKYQGVLTGLALGPNVLQALLPDDSGAQITITNHSSGGPVFSGPQVQPWTCNLGATSPQCDRPVTYQFLYMPVGAKTVPKSFEGSEGRVDPRFIPYDTASPPAAAAIAETTTDQGKTVPYIIRVETGSVNRGEYKIAVLYDPASPKPWTAWDPQPSWNHKLFTMGAGGCNHVYNEGAAPSVNHHQALSRGFAVMSTAHFTGGHTCNVVVQAESLMMAKEHLVEAYGPIRYTFAIGASGAALLQHWVANAFPGLYDGLIPQMSFPDGWEISRSPNDCDGPIRYWHDPTLWAPGVAWTPADQSFTQEGNLPTSCELWVGAGPSSWGNPPAGSDHAIPPEDQYDPQANPQGQRGTYWDYAVAQLGRRPAAAWGPVEQKIGHGFANRPLDNVGVQYGLKALMRQQISPAQFVDLNAKVGGYDIDYNWQPARTQADPAGLANSYRGGFINQANNMHVPIIEIPTSNNDEVHDSWHTWSMRARLDRANGNHDNQVIWLTGPLFLVGHVPPALPTAAFDLMDRWLAAIEADTTGRPLAEKVPNKPADAVDRCVTEVGVDQPCVVPPAGAPRLGAGEPITADTYKCQLKPLDRTSYFPALFTDAQWVQLQETFPGGVCDYSKPGVEQQPTIPWLSYENGPGGQPLGPAPTSTSL